MYTRKRDFFCDGLERLGLKHNRPQGTYFVLLDISDFLALDQFKGWSDMEFCEWMIREIGVAAVPGSSFFREPVNHLVWPSWRSCCRDLLRRAHTVRPYKGDASPQSGRPGVPPLRGTIQVGAAISRPHEGGAIPKNGRMISAPVKFPQSKF